MAQRDSQILEILVQRKRIEVAALADELSVSKVTIRKDLERLEGKGIIHREHGFALLSSADDVQGRLAYHYEEKQRIAHRAASFISNGDTVMIESGSCCALLALTIAETMRDVTIITNSAFIAGYIRGKPAANTVLLGGFYQNDAEVTVGPLLKQSCESLHVDYMFIGTDGYVEGVGFTNDDQFRGQAVRDMAACASKVVVLSESEKFSRRGVLPLDLAGKIAYAVTDEGIADRHRRALEASGVEVVIVRTAI
ncbi:transcriptional regulator, DeoR family [Coriobacterium glomerans PW2]|uniref:Lactose phosphotransferase system repressor n=1 Tax=Coriobacterium glomerans (strain ATCC 49209 / DSM 20642 / JCM 10262 / PW2) TaxID=700015 RepID=F2N712_CORGP|nr:DeoR/GlpR family DNA-binding transcription regulator [Coriobacterium glomerans]AEB06351.1 transcriptional regulator, DeoR family [Coriobacterium glomerans PW2]